MLWRGFQVVLTLFNVAFFFMGLYFFFRGGATAPAANQALEYKDFVSILLTAIGVMIAIAALFIAFLAIWTYKNAMEILTAAAAKAARERVDVLLPDYVDDQLRFQKEGAVLSDAEGVSADEIATAYGTEDGAK